MYVQYHTFRQIYVQLCNLCQLHAHQRDLAQVNYIYAGCRIEYNTTAAKLSFRLDREHRILSLPDGKEFDNLIGEMFCCTLINQSTNSHGSAQFLGIYYKEL